MYPEAWTATSPLPSTPTAPPNHHLVSMVTNKCNDTISPEASKYHFYGWAFVVPMAFVLIVAMLVTVFGNILVILTIWRHHGMRTRTNLFLANLALADILVGVLDMPFSAVTLIQGDWEFGSGLCQLNAFTNGLGLMTSTHTLMLISIHKYISITRPFSQVMTTGVISLMIGAAWLWSIIYNLAPFYGWTKVIYKKGATQCGPVMPCTLLERTHSYCNTLINLVTPIVVMIFCNVRIFRAVGRHLNRMRQTSNMDFRNTVLQQRRITVTLVIVIVCFFLCWTPYTVYSCMIALSKSHDWVPLILNPISYWCGYINSACNPVIYALRSPSFRQGYKEILFGRSTDGVSTGSFYSGTLTKAFRHNSKPKGRFYRNRNNNVLLKSNKNINKSNGAAHHTLKSSQSSPNILSTLPNGIHATDKSSDQILKVDDSIGKPWRSIQIPNNSNTNGSIHGSLEDILSRRKVGTSDECIEMRGVKKSNDNIDSDEVKVNDKLLAPELPLVTISRMAVSSDVGVAEAADENLKEDSNLETLSLALGGSLEKLHRQITQRRLRRHGGALHREGADTQSNKLLHPNDDAVSSKSSKSLRSSFYALFRKSTDIFNSQTKCSDEIELPVDRNEGK
ncbi:beta-2 adrenergic receptor-like isoform X2 [Ischnura elegans]|uniref:beta-2 adrenergic receptor-like isoform X2 n=1 Tax=Ischnura elegans TaxID=197161 RepID=UPI001ED89FAB|nr:beta-2 adrenergic receptor-like isoform X2 [Ischnura elegans]